MWRAGSPLARKTRSALLAIFALVACGGQRTGQSPRSEHPQAVIEVRDELGAYELVFRDLRREHASMKLLVEPELFRLSDTELNLILGSRGSEEKSRVSRSFPGTGPALRDLRRRNKRARLEVRFAPVATESELERMFRGDPHAGWVEFHRRFGSDAALVSFSQVGRSESHAVLVADVASGELTRWGTLFHLERQEEKWSVTGSVHVWDG